MDEKIKVFEAFLPAAEQIFPYLKQIDETHHYANFGPLETKFKEKLAEHFKTEKGSLACFSNGTSALTCALLAKIKSRGICLVPSWTFSATISSILAAGLTPYFVDVDLNTGVITPQLIKEILSEIPTQVDAVVPVSVFGVPLQIAAWEAFEKETGIPVVVDNAAGFATLKPSFIPQMVSFHATKVFAVGEGAAVVSKDQGLIERMRRISNFGFSDARISEERGLNAKMSEYLAAVGLVALEQWEETKNKYYKIAQEYKKHLLPKLLPSGFGENWISSVLSIVSPVPLGGKEFAEFLKNGIEVRRWWSKPCHLHPAYCSYPNSSSLQNTQAIHQHVFAVPFHLNLTKEQITHVSQHILRILALLEKKKPADKISNSFT